jgi:hypothetical protein
MFVAMDVHSDKLGDRVQLPSDADFNEQNILYMGADKSLARPGRKHPTSMSKSSWMMDPTRSREMPSCSATDLA